MSSSSSAPQRHSSAMHCSNLQTFLQQVTPIVPGRSSPPVEIYSGVDSKGASEFFYLKDLWQAFDEWSAYGVGSPIFLSNGDRVMQYYSPSLSGIQLFRAKSYSPASYNGERQAKSLCNDSTKIMGIESGEPINDHLQRSMLRKDDCADMYLEFYDVCTPYWRVPLTEKVLELAQKRPGIMSFRSTDLSPASWMAIAWYPIYHIPFKRTVKDLSTSFLTFHTLSSCFQETVVKDDKNEELSGQWDKKSGGSGRIRIALPPFALEAYKLQGDVWRNPYSTDDERFHGLHKAASSWLKQLNVTQHHDFNFFTSHSNIGMRNGMGIYN